MTRREEEKNKREIGYLGGGKLRSWRALGRYEMFKMPGKGEGTKATIFIYMQYLCADDSSAFLATEN
jgi:hypothetical protein